MVCLIFFTLIQSCIYRMLTLSIEILVDVVVDVVFVVDERTLFLFILRLHLN